MRVRGHQRRRGSLGAPLPTRSDWPNSARRPYDNLAVDHAGELVVPGAERASNLGPGSKERWPEGSTS